MTECQQKFEHFHQHFYQCDEYVAKQSTSDDE